MSTTFSQRIYDFFRNNPDGWFLTADVFRRNPGVPKSSIYNTISVFSTKEPKYLLSRKSSAGYNEYAFNKDAPIFASKGKSKGASRVNIVQATFVDTKPNQEHVPHHVYWTDEEKRKLAKELISLRKKNPYFPTSDLIAMMQSVLPEGRRRLSVKKMSDIPWMDNLVNAIKLEEAKVISVASKLQNPETKPAESAITQTLPQPIQPQTPALLKSKQDITDQIARLDQKQAEREGDSVPATDPVKALSLDSLFDEIGRRFASTIKSAMIAAINSEEVQNAIKLRADINIHHTQEKPEGIVKEDKRPKVVIIGLRKDHHIEEIKRDFGGFLNITFALPETPIQSVKNMASHAEIFFVIDNVNYRHANNLRDALVKFNRVEGIGYLRDKLTENYQKYKFM